MIIRILLLLLLLTNSLVAQTYKLRKATIIGAGAMFIAGTANGTHETIHYHYDQFKSRFPNANDRFWNPDISWRNKYKNGDVSQGERFPGSSTTFVFTTDAKHLLGTIHRGGLIVGGFTIAIGEKRPWWHYTLDFAIVGVAYSAGFHGTYTLFFR